VPEVWRATSDGLTFNILENGVYQVRPHSLSFPQLASADLVRFLVSFGRTGATALVAEFRHWVRQVLLAPPDRNERVKGKGDISDDALTS
jgi:hypothetical protein